MPAEDAIQKLAKLSPRERQVLGLVCDGFSYKDITAKLYISMPTVKSVMGRVYVKLNLDQLDKAGRTRAIHQVYCPLLKDAWLSPEPVSPEPVPSEVDEPVPMAIMKMVDEDELVVIPTRPAEVIDIPQKNQQGTRGNRTRWLVVGIFAGVLATVCLVAGILLGSRFLPRSIPAQATAPIVAATEIISAENTSIPFPTSTQMLPSSTPEILEVTAVETDTPQPTAPLIPTSTVPSIAFPFSDDFSNGANPAWQVLSGDWLTTNGRYTISNADSTWGFSVLDDPTWTNYRIKVNVQLESSDEGEIAVVVRYGGGKYLLFRVVNIWTKGGWAFYDGNNFTDIAGLSSIGHSQQFDLEVDAIGNEFIAKINGMEFQRINLSGHETGGVGLGINCFYPPCASFSNFQVTAP